MVRVAQATQNLSMNIERKDVTNHRRNEKLLLLKDTDMSCECLAGDYPQSQAAQLDKLDTLNLNNWVHPSEQQSRLAC